MSSKIKIKIQEIGTEYHGLVFVIILTKDTEANILLLSNFNGMSCFAAKTDKKRTCQKRKLNIPGTNGKWEEQSS